MDRILQEVDQASKKGFLYLAVAMSLTLPDICAALASDNGESSGPKYQAWCRDNLASLYPEMTALDFWKLRCGVLHQGKFGHPQMQFDRVLFTTIRAHRNILMNALHLDVATFCDDMVKAVRRWLVANEKNNNVIAHLPNLVQYRPDGLKPYIGGVPVIA